MVFTSYKTTSRCYKDGNLQISRSVAILSFIMSFAIFFHFSTKTLRPTTVFAFLKTFLIVCVIRPSLRHRQIIQPLV